MALPPGTLIGKFRIISHLGAGAMGEVYLAKDTQLNRQVALKLLPNKFVTDQDRLSRFKKEAIIASQLNHPNIITVHEIGHEDDKHFIATEFVDGETLRRRMTGKSIEIDDALDIAIQIVGALEVAHGAGIIHRDIKPENIMIRSDGLVKVLDFGLAKLTEKYTADQAASTLPMSTSEPGVRMGTPLYMSPEQARAAELDSRTDIWSVGVVLYEMISGRKPFSGATVADVISSIINDDPPSLREKPEVSEGLDWIVMRSLKKIREERYQRSKDLLIELRHLKEVRIEATGHSYQPHIPGQQWTNGRAADYLQQPLFDVLIQIRAQFVEDDSLYEKPSFWSLTKKASRDRIVNMIDNSEAEIRVAAYSFTTYKDDFEKVIENFLEKGGKLRALMLAPRSAGFLEKTAFEGFGQRSADDFKTWQRITEARREKHEGDIETSIKYLREWQRIYGKDQVDFRLYSDTPNINGMLFDDKGMLISSYFINPTSRGFENPAVVVEAVDAHANLRVLQRMFWQWFEIKFATGQSR